MTNYGALAILALPLKREGKVPSAGECELRWLIVLETIPPGKDGWRLVGGRLIADLAHVSYRTSRRVRDRMIAAGVVEYRQGCGRGNRSSYRFLIPLKVSAQGGHLYDEKGGQSDPVKVDTYSDKGGHPDAPSSGFPSIALEPSALEPSALLRPRSSAAIIRRSFPDATDDEIRQIEQTVTARGARNAAAVIAKLASERELRLPCDTDGPGRHREACRNGDNRTCSGGWCECRCHTAAVAA